MDLSEMIFGLVTYNDSEYLEESGIHRDFCYLTRNLKIQDDKILISDKNDYDLDCGIKHKTKMLRGVIKYAKSLINTQVRLILLSKNYGGPRNYINLLDSINVSIKIFAKIAITIIFHRKKNAFYNEIRRHGNISSNHIKILEDSLSLSGEFLLILEDDFRFSNGVSMEIVLKNLMSEFELSPEIKIMNISKSFEEHELGLSKIQRKSKKIKVDRITEQSLITYDFPVVNTMCATIYKVNELDFIVAELKSLDIYPFIPIDHKLNITINNLIKKKMFTPYAYASLVPGVLIQGSLHGK